MQRRTFFQQSFIAGATWICGTHIGGESTSMLGTMRLSYDIELISPTKLFDGKTCWVHPRAGLIPGAGKPPMPRIVMTMNSLDLQGSDVFKGMFGFESDDMGRSWSKIKMIEALAPKYEMIEAHRRPVAVSDFWPKFHRISQTLLGIGHTVAYTPDWEVKNPRPRHTSYSTYDPKIGVWKEWNKLVMPDQLKFYNAGAGCAQRYDGDDGDILLPISFRPKGRNSLVTVVRCNFDGAHLTYVRNGSELYIDDSTRGLHEPSLTQFDGQYFLTIRNDQRGFVTSSEDGLHFEPIRPWKFDDGEDLGNYNTQQHWVTHSAGLFLVYTRSAGNNDHVFRHRAPLFMAEVDPKKMCVIRNTEKILVPERGARLGNFGVLDVSPQETWVTVSEWMQPKGVERYGSDGSIWIAKINWDKKNELFKDY